MMLAYNKIAFYIGNIPVAWYALCILSGVLLAVIMAVREARKLGINPDIIYDGVLFILPAAILGARLYFVLFDSFVNGSYYNWNILKILGFVFDDGKITGFRLEGLGIHGGIIVAFIGVIIYCRVKKISVWQIVDLVAPGFLIGQICGRWGNFMNQEVYGGIVENLNWLPKFISDQMFIDGHYRQPLFLYEGLWNLAALIAILIIRRFRVLKVGDILCVYLIWYGIGRAWMEPLRDQVFILQSNISNMQSVLTSIGLIVAGVGLLVYKYIWRKDLPYYVDTLVSEEEYVETKTILKIKNFFKEKFGKQKKEEEKDDKDDSL